MRRLELSAAARADLKQIWYYTKATWDQSQADLYLQLIDRALAGLASGDAKSIRRRASPYFSLKIASHQLYFRQDENSIFIVRVLHERMSAPRHLPD